MTQESTIEFESKGFQFKAFYCKPNGTEPNVPKERSSASIKSHILLVHEVHGLSDKIKDISRYLAKHGYAVFAPDLWSRIGTPTLPDHNAILRKLQATPDTLMLDHIADAKKHMQEKMGVEKIAMFGLGIGGTWAMLFTAREDQNDLSACLSLYGTLIREPGQKKTDPIDLIDGIKCPILFISGALDDSPVVVPKHDVERLATVAQKKGKDCRTILLEKAGYAFCNPALKYYNESFCNDSLAQVVRFLDEKVKR